MKGLDSPYANLNDNIRSGKNLDFSLGGGNNIEGRDYDFRRGCFWDVKT